jgi:hypothetical protein
MSIITLNQTGKEKKMEQLTFRHELKHFINYFDYYSLISRLKQITKPDPHVDSTGTYMIHSIYFDNADDKALFEKINGFNKREKFRMRYYKGSSEFIKLEKKSKINGLCNKQSVKLTREQCEKLLANDYLWLRESSEELLLELYTKMKNEGIRPKTISCYRRMPFVYAPGNVRITIDSELRTAMSSLDFLNQELPMVSVGTADTMILEVKYDEFLPDIIKDIVQIGTRPATACSKYALSRSFI